MKYDAEENLVVDIQLLVYQLKNKQGFDRTRLAEEAGVTLEEVDAFFADDADPTVREAARLVHALGCRLLISLSRK